MSEDQSQDLTQVDIENLKVRADRLGVKYHPSIGVEKLREKIAEALAGEQPKDQPVVAAAAPVEAVAAEESLAEKRKRLRNDALRLIRVRITCMNPAKKDWEGEIITTGNGLVPTIRHYVPFNADDGWHIPHMLYLQLRDRQCQIFYTDKSKPGTGTRRGKLIKEFAIEVLPALTEEELHELAQRQAMSHSVG